MTSPAALDTATAVVNAAADLAHTPWEQVTGPDAIALAEALCTSRSLLDAALLRSIDRLEETDALRKHGWATVKDFLTHLTGGHKGTGGGLVRAAAQLRDLPHIRTALEDGRVTLPQARAIAGKVHSLPHVSEFRDAVAARMLDLVETHGHDASDLESGFTDVVHEFDPDHTIIDADKEKDKQERGAHTHRHLSIVPDGTGGVKLTGSGTVEDGELIKATLFPLAAPQPTDPGACGGRDRQPGEPHFDENGEDADRLCRIAGCRHDGRDPREHGARLWDALVEACQRLQDTEQLPADHGVRPRIVVTIDQDSLKQQVIDAGLACPAETTSGAQISARTVRQMACDADIIPVVLNTDGQVLDVGRTHRLVTPAQWTALIVRDKHCAFPGCHRIPLACDAHHIVHWADGGDTDLDNLVMLCRHHHTLIHHSPWTVHVDPGTGQPRWTRPPQTSFTERMRRFREIQASQPPVQPPQRPPAWPATGPIRAA